MFESGDERSFAEFDFKFVVEPGFGLCESRFGCALKCGAVGGLIEQVAFGFLGTPGPSGNAAKSDASVCDSVAVGLERNCSRGECKFVAGAVTDFQIVRANAGFAVRYGTWVINSPFSRTVSTDGV